MKKRRGNSSELATEIQIFLRAIQSPTFRRFLPASRCIPNFTVDFWDMTATFPFTCLRYGKEPHREFHNALPARWTEPFDPRTSFVRGQTWRAAETADTVIEAREVEPLVIVGIANSASEEQRLADTRLYVTESWAAADGKYGRFITEEVMPFIGSNYRARSGRHAYRQGLPSADGDALSWSEVFEIFGQLAALSPSIWWSKKKYYRVR